MEVRPWTVTSSAATDLARAAAFDLGPLTVDPSTRRINGDGRNQTVEPRVMRVLVALGEQPGRVLSRDELIELCWDGQIVTDNAITRVISLLRHALDDLSRGAVKIETIKKVGIRLVVGPAEPSTDPEPADVAEPSPARRHWPLRLLAVLAVLAVLTVAGAAMVAWVAQRSGVDHTAALTAWANTQPASEHLANPADQPRIGVLAFQPADDGESARLIANGLTADIASALSKYDVTVVAPSSSLQIPPDLKAKAGALLGADFVIDGRVSGTKGKMTVHSQISDTRKNILIYAFDTPQEADLGGDVAKQIASHLTLALNPTKLSTTLGRKTTPEDYALMARANEAIEKLDAITWTDLTHQLAARHPDDGELQANAGFSTLYALPNLPESERAGALRSARALIQRGEDLNPNSGSVLTAKELLIDHEPMQMPEQERLLRRAIEYSPSLPQAYDGLGDLMGNVGRVDESIKFFQRSMQLNPLSSLHAWGAVGYLIQFGNVNDVKQIMEKAKVLWPDQPFEYLQYYIDDETKSYQDERELEKRLPPKFDIVKADKSHNDLILQALITKDNAVVRRAVENCFLDFGKTIGQVGDDHCLQFMVSAGALDDAYRFASLAYPDNRALYPSRDDRWLTKPVPGIGTVRLFNPNMAPFRDDPRFWPVAVRTGLVNYWQTTQKWPDFCLSQLDRCKAMASKAAQANPPHVTGGLH
jgi:DNA-binding winged helix-turn-helix (wHTH) protein/TolB-like protein